MTKQEEIREGIAFELFWVDCGAGDRTDAKVYWGVDAKVRKEWKHRADLLIAYLHSQDVVIKVERELLPKVATDLESRLDGIVCQATLNAVKNAGYVAVEPLITEGGESLATEQSPPTQ